MAGAALMRDTKKNQPNPFLQRGLKEMFETSGAEEVVVVRAMSHMCINATVRSERF